MRDLASAGELVSVDQAVIDYSVSAATLYRHLKGGRLRRFRGGLGDARTYLNRAELEGLIQVKSAPSVAGLAQMQGRLVTTGRWADLPSNAHIPEDPVLEAVLGTFYGVAQLDDTRWSVNWFHPERGLTCWYSGDQRLVLSILDDLANRTEAATGTPLERIWRSPSLSTGHTPRLEELRGLKDEIVGIAARHGASNIRVFGSVARGDAEPSSDIDLLVDLERDRTALDFSGLILELEELLGRSVDVGEESALLQPVRSRVLREAVPL